MANVCVITGGGSGIGLETARNIDKDVILVLTRRTVEKLERAKKSLEEEGHEVHLIACDVSDRGNVHELCALASELGTIKTVIHAAGLSPTMADPECQHGVLQCHESRGRDCGCRFQLCV